MAVNPGQALVRYSEPANADISGSQYLFVEYTNGNVVACNAAGDFALGVLENAPEAAGRAAQVVMLGGCKVISGAGITKGDLIGTDAAGKAITVAPIAGGAQVGHAVLGRAMETASGADEIIGAFIDCIAPYGAQ